ncbi:MAG: ABC transporter permease, partial [Blastocatellia bacterium]
MSNLIQDVRYGLRLLVKQPGFTMVVLITLALGIGANAAIFSVISGVLLRSLPYSDPSRVVFVWEKNAMLSAPFVPSSSLNYRDWKQQNHSFQSMAARKPFAANLGADDRSERISGEQVSSDYFTVLGLRPVLGRDFNVSDDKKGAAPVVLLSEALWKRRFGANPNLVGQTIKLNGVDTTVAGVMPTDFRPTVEFWTPMYLEYTNADRLLHDTAVVARLAPGVSIQKAQAEMDTIAGQLAQQYPDLNSGWSVLVMQMQDSVVVNIRTDLLVLFGAVALVLLIACANVANLLVARAASREREIAIRIALGASRARLVRQVLAESLLLSFAGGAIGVILAGWGTSLLVKLNEKGIPRASEIKLDVRVVLFTAALSVLAGVLFGLVPALGLRRTDISSRLKDGARAVTAGGAVQRLRSILVIGEIAISLVLLAGAGLALRSFSSLQRVDTGFNPNGMLSFQVFLPPSQYPKPENQEQFQKDALEHLREIQGVESASTISFVPLATGGPRYIFWADGHPLPIPTKAPIASYRAVGPGYFKTMRIPLIGGREFSDFDKGDSESVAIVNRSFAAAQWPGQDAVGKRISVGVPLKPEDVQWAKVVGVVGDVHQTTLNGEPGMEMYLPMLQDPPHLVNFVVRAQVDPLTIVEPARRSIASVNAGL